MKKRTVTVVIAALVLLAAQSAFSDSRILSLEECLKIAIKNSPQVGSQREQLRSARTNVLRNYGYFLPSASLSMSAGRTFIGPTGSIAIDEQGRAIKPTGFDYESYSFRLQSTMNVFDWGVSVRRLNEARSTADAAGYDLEWQQDIITAVVIRSYYDFLRTKKLKEVQEQGVDAAKRNLEQVEAFFTIGSNTKADVLQARVRLANTQLALITARNNMELAKSKLANDLNLPLDEDFEIVESITIKPIEPSLEEEVTYMFTHRSDLLSLRSRVRSARNALAASQNSRWPSLGAYFSYSWNDRQWPEDSNFFRSEYSWGIGLSLNFDIFDRFATKSSIMSAKAQTRIAEYQLQMGKLDAVYEVQQIVLSLKEAMERINLSEETVSQAEENLRLAEERYRVGAGTILETIEAGVSLTEAKANLVQAQCDYLIAKAELLRATGREVRAD
ncbi:MAG: TolC family protein [Candidatus Latescibacteria bacterium]|nr:TolC family protein [Candidatus Latescibacterota bacterium]NIO27300.1 TolC family protein [Candidatus Latescibacterota bacterium]NIO54824.1 TolC family protein [Candidatus Latescibacterota bacterium]NIT00907.1 TolC family protein [Candidatus Latescibacterota bacterium]NIT37830.1 TolC family protein [Candidatus Latescibacterota bacterium]